MRIIGNVEVRTSEIIDAIADESLTSRAEVISWAINLMVSSGSWPTTLENFGVKSRMKVRIAKRVDAILEERTRAIS